MVHLMEVVNDNVDACDRIIRNNSREINALREANASLQRQVMTPPNRKSAIAWGKRFEEKACEWFVQQQQQTLVPHKLGSPLRKLPCDPMDDLITIYGDV